MMKTAGLSLLLLSSSMMATAAEAAQKIGYVNTAQVFQSLPQKDVVQQQLQEEFKDKDGELKKLAAERMTLIEKVKRNKDLMTADEMQNTRIEIGKLESTLDIKQKSLQGEFKRREAQETQKLLKVISNATQKVAEKNGYDIVFDIQGLAYAKPEHNISELVINELK